MRRVWAFLLEKFSFVGVLLVDFYMDSNILVRAERECFSSTEIVSRVVLRGGIPSLVILMVKIPCMLLKCFFLR